MTPFIKTGMRTPTHHHTDRDCYALTKKGADSHVREISEDAARSRGTILHECSKKRLGPRSRKA